MDYIRAAGATINQIPGDWSGNRQRILALLEEATRNEVDIICFPELSITGYNCEDLFFTINTVRQSQQVLLDLCQAVENIIAVVGLPIYFNGYLYNGVAVIQKGKIVGINLKKSLPKEGVHYEPRWFDPWQIGRKETLSIGDQSDIPIGDLRYQFGGFAMGVEICEEAWSLSGHNTLLAEVELIVNPSASHFALGKYPSRETLVANNSREMQCHYLYTNLVGVESGRLIYDGGVLFATSGSLTKRGPRFSFGPGCLTIQDLDLDRVRVAKLRNRVVKFTTPTKGGGFVLGKDFEHEEKKIAVAQNEKIHFCAEKGNWLLKPEEEFLAAEIIGLWDYLRKSGLRGFVVSLSGGSDSSAAAVLIVHSLFMAFQELGEDAFCAHLGIQKKSGDFRSYVKDLLALVYQKTENNSCETQLAAKGLAQELGGEYFEVDIQGVVNQVQELAEGIRDKKFSWQEDDTTLQNIQARSRAMLPWVIANDRNALLIATSNRSEVAVGYATMDGDTAGGLAPLGGISKSFLINWLHWATYQEKWGMGPISSLKKVLAIPPTAELRPQGEKQQDERDLMPYAILNRIEQLLVWDRKSPTVILGFLEREFSEYPANTIKKYLTRFLRLWGKNQWKRERYAPSFHLDFGSLDPKSWCRFPIFSSSFADEIEQLED